MAQRRAPHDAAGAAPSRGSLSDQLRALPRPAAPKAPPAPAPKPAGPTFEELAGAVLPLAGAGKNMRAAAPLAPGGGAPGPSAPAPDRPRLWVEQRPDLVRARHESVPVKVLAELEAGRLVPRRQLDLHRMSAAAAREALDAGIKQARRDGIPCLLVVCGRGLHSGLDGPVLPDVVVERLSEELSPDVLAFTSAPRKWGGAGALIVLLRPKLTPGSSEP